MITTLLGRDGARVDIAHQGAQVLSWQHASRGELLFLSKTSLLHSGKAVRGGIPVIFPQFADLGPLSKHGFARTELWQPVATNRPELARFSLRETTATLALWPYPFLAELSVLLSETALEIELTIHNTGTHPFAFTAALHTYFAVSHIDQVSITGLQHLTYRDSVTAQECHEPNDLLSIHGEVDRIYRNAPEQLKLADAQNALLISKQGFADTVIWNPGQQRGATLGDLEPLGYAKMICIEAAAITEPILLFPSTHWQASQRTEVGRISKA